MRAEQDCVPLAWSRYEFDAIGRQGVGERPPWPLFSIRERMRNNVMASQNLALRRHAGRSQQPTAAASGDVLNWFAVKRGTSDASHEVRSVVVTSLSWPCYHPRRARHGARGVDAAGCPRHPTTAASPSGTITDGPGRTSIAGPGRASPAAGRIETRSTAVHRETSPQMEWLCRPTRCSGCRIRGAAARILPASALLLSIPQPWWSAFRPVLVGLGKRLLRTMDFAGF